MKHVLIVFFVIIILSIVGYAINKNSKTSIEDIDPIVNTDVDPAQEEVVPSSLGVTTSIGEENRFNDIIVVVNDVLEDNRCPSDVQCIQAGRALVSINILSLEGEHILTKEIEETGSFFAGSTKISLKKVKPETISTSSISKNQYTFDLLFEVIE